MFLLLGSWVHARGQRQGRTPHLYGVWVNGACMSHACAHCHGDHVYMVPCVRGHNMCVRGHAVPARLHVILASHMYVGMRYVHSCREYARIRGACVHSHARVHAPRSGTCLCASCARRVASISADTCVRAVMLDMHECDLCASPEGCAYDCMAHGTTAPSCACRAVQPCRHPCSSYVPDVPGFKCHISACMAE